MTVSLCAESTYVMCASRTRKTGIGERIEHPIHCVLSQQIALERLTALAMRDELDSVPTREGRVLDLVTRQVNANRREGAACEPEDPPGAQFDLESARVRRGSIPQCRGVVFLMFATIVE